MRKAIIFAIFLLIVVVATYFYYSNEIVGSDYYNKSEIKNELDKNNNTDPVENVGTLDIKEIERREKEENAGIALKEEGVGGSSNIGVQRTDGNDINNFCSLVRPGNLPNLICDVNYIKKGEVSLKISNNIGENVNVYVILKECPNEGDALVENGESRNFVFSCSFSNYFESDIILTYTIGDKVVEATGIVGGFTG